MAEVTVPEEIVQQALAAARTAMYTSTDRNHKVPGITLEGAIRAALAAVWPRDVTPTHGASSFTKMSDPYKPAEHP